MSHRSRKDGRSRKLRIEPLEDRRLLAGVTVGNNLDIVNGDTTSIAALIATPGADGISVREAILAANATAGADQITFDVSLTSGGPAIITLTQGQLRITGVAAITGPGAMLLTIDASGNDPTPTADNGDGSRVFLIDDGAGTLIDVEISGLTLTGGDVRLSSFGVRGSGGAIASTENLTVANCVMVDNFTSEGGFGGFGGGGAIYSNPGALIVRDSTINNNRALGEGGGIRKRFGDLTVERSTISGNASQSSGGGISTADGGGVIVIRDSTLNDNFSASVGGGLFLSKTSTATISGSTISSNRAVLYGGGISAWAPLTVLQSTVASNVADSDVLGAGGGVDVDVLYGGSLALMHSIVAGNRRGAMGDQFADDVNGANVVNSVKTASYSLVGVNAGPAFSGSGNQIGTSAAPINPLLGPLANNGGPTQTHALLPGSPALDAGDPAVVFNAALFDQRGAGFARVVNGDNVAGARIDIGAYESQGIPSWPVGDYNRNGIADTADHTFWANHFGSSTSLGFQADGNNNGVVDAADYSVWRDNFGNTVVPVSSAAVSAAIPVAIPTSATTVTIGTNIARREALPPLTRGAHEALLLAARQAAFAELGEEVSAVRSRSNNSRGPMVGGVRGIAFLSDSLSAGRRGL